MRVKATIEIRVLENVLDIQGQAICKALHHKGLKSIESVSQGKLMDIILEVKNLEAAKKVVKEACSSVLVNKHIEGFTFHLEEVR